jgi:hypothetical protein
LDDTTKPLRSKVLANKNLQTRYLQHVRTIATDLLSWEVLGPQVAQARALLSDAVAKDTRKLATTEAFQIATSPDLIKDVATLRSFAEKRAAYLLGHDAIKALPKKLVPLSQVIQPRVSKIADWPRVVSALGFSEIMAVDANEAAGIKERSTDWVELHNNGKKAIDLTDHFLSDDPSHPEKWAFPKGSKIGPGKYLVIWADKANEPGLHANFKLSKKGEHLVLSHKHSILSEVQFPRQTRGSSYGQIKGQWMTLIPTPAAPNRAAEGQH